MLNNLHIKNFRMLEDLEIPKLGRVNLIVGKNNSGKSTVLEALRLYAGKANSNLLREILLGHDESVNLDGDSVNESIEGSWFSLKNLFFNREFPKTSDDSIGMYSDQKELLKIEFLLYTINEEPELNENGELLGVIRKRTLVNPSAINDSDDSSEVIPAVRITQESGRTNWIDLPSGFRRSLMASRNFEDSSMVNCSYVSTEFSSPDTLAKLWDNIALKSEHEDAVYSALRIVDSSVERITFIEDRSKLSNRDVSRLCIVKMKGFDNRIPLNSMGDGMSRILQLILSVFPAKDGILLIDEFENGLHFSVQEEVWRIIFKLAKELNIQVFATTHSWDCIESFTKIAVESPEEGVLLKISKSRSSSDNGKVIATTYDESELKTITASDLEVR